MCDADLDWPIQSFWPVRDRFYPSPSGWDWDGWANWVAAVILLALCGRFALGSGPSVAESLLSPAADAEGAAALRRRVIPEPATSSVRP